MGLRLHNTLTRTKQDFVPIDPQNVRMYVCGPTVYDFAHIGNARPLIVFDVLFRMLRHLYGPEHVTYVRNITDIDDKIIARAAADCPNLPLNEAVQRVTETTEKQFHEDVRALGCLEPTVEPRATEHIAEMKAMIETLVEKGFAYVAEDHVLFHVAAMPDYGCLSNRSLDEMIAGARVEVAPYKKDPMDFVLWKPSKGREPAWRSPAGIATPGRPGWHLECSAMSDRWLWEAARGSLSDVGLSHPHQFDIHGGGIDLVFPHHENEIAQSRSAHGTPAMANYWLHNGYLQVEGEKMAKSAGNFVTVRELLSTEAFGGRSWPGGVLRFAMLQTDYRQPLDWTVQRLTEAAEELDNWAGLLDQSYLDLLNSPDVSTVNSMALARGEAIPSKSLVEALCDDVNGPKSIASLRASYTTALNGDAQARLAFLWDCEFVGFFRGRNFMAYVRQSDWAGSGVVPSDEDFRLRHELKTAIANDNRARQVDLTEMLVKRGWDVRTRPDGYVALRFVGQDAGSDRISATDVNEKVAARAAARKAKNWAEADRIRDELDAMGIALKDSRNPETGELETTWEVKR